MAVSDLTKELEKETYKPDVASQKRIVAGLVAVLTNDTASEVRSCVIKWYVDEMRKLRTKNCFCVLHSPIWQSIHGLFWSTKVLESCFVHHIPHLSAVNVEILT